MLLLAPALVFPAYRFDPAKPVEVRVKLTFDGFLPLLGGQTGGADVAASFRLVGVDAGSAKAALTSFRVDFNGARLPVDLDDAKRYFPSSVFGYAPTGALRSWNAPAANAPIRLPGFDAKRLPETVFLPLTFPAGGVELGRTFESKLTVQGGEGTVEATPTALKAGLLSLKIEVAETYTTYEDEALDVTTRKDAATRVETSEKGTGSGTFDLALGRFVAYSMKAVSTGRATDLATSKTSTRRLTRTIVVSAGPT